MNHEILFVTSNEGKFEEVKESIKILSNMPLNLIKNNMDLDEIQSNKQNEIVIKKAIQAWNSIKQPLLVEDTGLFINKYKNFPGTLTKFIVDGIGITNLQDIIPNNTPCYFKATFAYIINESTIKCFEGKTNGKLFFHNNNSEHKAFSLSKYFIPTGSAYNYAYLKNLQQQTQYSYRHKALKKFIAYYFSHLSLEIKKNN